MWFFQIIERLMGRRLSSEEVNKFIVDYMEGALPEDISSKFEKHISSCTNCYTYYEQYKATVALIKDESPIDPPAELVEHTLAFLQENL